MYTDPDPQFLAPAWSMEIGRVEFISMCRPGNPIAHKKNLAHPISWSLLLALAFTSGSKT